MAEPQHPLAPEAETAEEKVENTTEAVEVRGAVEVSAMRYVLGIGLVLAILAFVAVYLFGGVGAG